jgi:transcriptional regulator with PAS, ATPase and Fis domain
MQEIEELIGAMAPSDANVLIAGESGVGKEVIANAIHARSRRAGQPMVKLNCAAFPQTMIEGELFGYVKGAFTGAMHDFPGMIAAADGGTLFLDEISDMPADLQTRFLRVLQEREYRPLGSTQTMKANFRAIAATNRPIPEALAENRLRSDLYYRLNTFQIEVPPLRKRREDIPPLIGQFVRQFSQQLGKPEPDVSPDAFQKLLDYSWPGNVRELQNAIEYAVVLAREGVIGVKELPAEIQLPPALQQAELGGLPRKGVQTLDDLERNAILQALAECHGNKKKAAELLGIQRPTLYNKLKRYAIELYRLEATYDEEMKPAVVLLSGGIDSTTTLAIAIAEGLRNIRLSFDYGQRHQIETEAARRVANSLGVKEHRIAKIDLRVFGGSALTDDVAVPKQRSEKKSRTNSSHIRSRAQHHLSRVCACLGGSDSGQ